MNMAKMMLKIIVNKVIIKCINIIVMMVLNMKVKMIVLKMIVLNMKVKMMVLNIICNDGIEYDGTEDYM